MKLRDNYEIPLLVRIASTAFAERMADPDRYLPEDGDADALYTILCYGLAMYVEAWAESGTAPAGPASFVLDADDTEDPNRIHDPTKAVLATLFTLALESIEDNARNILGLPEVTE